MSEILSQLWTPELQMAVTAVIVLLVALYVLSVIWVVRDAYQRGTLWYAWAVVALIPVSRGDRLHPASTASVADRP